MPADPRARLPLLPALAAGALLLGVIAQMAIPVETVLPEVGPSRAQPPRLAVSIATPVAPGRIIAERTLFTPSRRVGMPGVGILNATGGVQTDAFPGSTLLGTARAGGFAVALIRDPAGHPHSLRVGDRIGAWHLLAIARDGATFANGATRKSLGVGETAAVQPTPAQNTPEVESQ